MPADNDNQLGGAAGASLIEDGLLDSGMRVGIPKNGWWVRWPVIGCLAIAAVLYTYVWATSGDEVFDSTYVIWIADLTKVLSMMAALACIRGFYRGSTTAWYLLLGFFVFQTVPLVDSPLSYLIFGSFPDLTYFLSRPYLTLFIIAVITGLLPATLLLLKPVREAYNSTAAGIFWTLFIGSGLRALATVAMYIQV